MTDINEPNGTGKTADADSARIAKVIARAGLASRRDAEVMVEEGRVSLNGRIITSPAVNVGPDDKVAVDGKPLPARERTRLWLYHKPRGLVTTAKDPEGRQTVFEVLPEELPRVVSVGRLDLNTEGLLLLTNDGGLARVLSHPDTAWLRRYRVRAYGDVTPDVLGRLRDGIEIDGFSYGPIEAEIDRKQGDNVWLVLGLREGKNREVRRVLEHLGLTVNRLIRVSFGPFQLGDMPEGSVEEIRTRYLRDQLGSLADDAGCDFEAPIVDRTQQPKRSRVLNDEPVEGVRRRNGLTTDRKGRRVFVERIEKEKPAPRPERSRDERPRGDFGGRPAFGEGRGREDRPTGDHGAARPRHPQGERTGPRTEWASRERPAGARSRPPEKQEFRGDRPAPGDRGGPRPFRSREDGPRPERTERPRSDRPAGDRPYGDRPNRDRPQGERPRGDRPFSDRPQGGRPRGDRPSGDRPQGERPRGDRPFGDRPQGDRPRGDRPFGGRPQGDRPRTDRPFGDRPREDRRPDERPRGRADGQQERGARPPRREGFAPRGDDRGAERPRSGENRGRPFQGERPPRAEGGADRAP
ncbi:pseudouridine synthase, partial [Terrihabitans rhizophilus]